MDTERMLEVLAKRQDHLETMLKKLDWPLPAHLGAKWLDDVADAYFSGTIAEQDVLEALVDKYRAHGLQDVRNEWMQDPSIATRLPILKDVLTAHEQGVYTLSVPVVLAQLEGLIASAQNHQGLFTTKNLTNYLKLLEASSSRFQRLTVRFVIERLWRPFQHGAAMPDLSRHAILHGADTQYGTAPNSLRAILSFDSTRRALADVRQRVP